MSIDLFSQMNFDNQESWKEFHFVHGYQHQIYSSIIITKYGKQIPEFDLSEVDLKNNMEMSNWLQVHNQVHQWIASVTGLGETPDLETVDLKDKNQFYDWMYYHNLIHDQIDLVLGAQ